MSRKNMIPAHILNSLRELHAQVSDTSGDISDRAYESIDLQDKLAKLGLVSDLRQVSVSLERAILHMEIYNTMQVESTEQGDRH